MMWKTLLSSVCARIPRRGHQHLNFCKPNCLMIKNILWKLNKKPEIISQMEFSNSSIKIFSKSLSLAMWPTYFQPKTKWKRLIEPFSSWTTVRMVKFSAKISAKLCQSFHLCYLIWTNTIWTTFSTISTWMAMDTSRSMSLPLAAPMNCWPSKT